MSGLIVMEPGQLQNQNGGKPTEKSLLLHVHVESGRLQAVVKVGVTSDLHRICSKVRLVSEVLVVTETLCPVVAVEQLHYRVAPDRRIGSTRERKGEGEERWRERKWEGEERWREREEVGEASEGDMEKNSHNNNINK